MSAVSNMATSTSSSSHQQFCLKWNNHTANFIKTLNEMITEESFVDVTLACEGSSLKAHKMVLSACSNYFKELFLSNPCPHPIVILKDMKIEDLKAIIDFMYKGEVNVSQNQLGALLKTAEILKVKGLTEVNDDNDKNLGERKCGPQMEEISGTPSNCNNGTNNVSSGSGCSGRKKRRRRARKGQGGSSGDEASGSDSGPTSEDEEIVDVPGVKRLKESAQSLLGQTQQQQSSQQSSQQQAAQHSHHQPNIPDGTSNVMQTRRRALQLPQVQQGLNQVQNQLSIQEKDGMDNNSDGNLEDSSEAWVQRQLSLTRQVTDADDESDEVIDVKPLVTFDEGSMGSMGTSSVNNSVAMPSDCLGNQMDVGVMSPGNQSGASAYEIRQLTSATSSYTPKSCNSLILAETLEKIDQGLLPSGFGRCPICNKSLFHLKRHMNEVHLGVVYKCHLCGRRFKRTDKLNSHMAYIHSM